ncbi:hypothetical protein QE418_002138 [Microbacterium testaceum]|uniref:hypothetical protein n=1 Tax=Microbacterium testaceum TaxID=2033 RepID=UPI00278826CD|nr:hypothetical protein [Microbacterium testaceum]MDQ1112690.1 hypothetical protein [Microbacterium testaceum]
MSGPYDRAEDPDEVTLWAGRLRAWPTPPAVEDDDETILTRRDAADDETVSATDAPADETVISRRIVPEDDTLRSGAEAPADETVISRRIVPEDDTLLSRVEVPDDETVISRIDTPHDGAVSSRPMPAGAPVAEVFFDEELGTTAPRSAAPPVPTTTLATPRP